MKKLFFALMFWGAAFALSSCSKDAPSPAFPDANFRAELVKLGFTETDGDIDPDNDTNKALFLSTTELYLYEKKIASLKGIEYFTALINLYCDSNRLSALDLSKNTVLTELSCFDNRLSTLDVSKNTTLTFLRCLDNRLSTLDLSQNTALTYLSCPFNELTALDVSKNTELTYLDCSGNHLTTLDLSKNTKLTQLSCGDNRLAILDISQNAELAKLDCEDNQLSIPDRVFLHKIISYRSKAGMRTKITTHWPPPPQLSFPKWF